MDLIPLYGLRRYFYFFVITYHLAHQLVGPVAPQGRELALVAFVKG